MKKVADNDELLIQYLLGELGEEENESVEQRYISDRAFYEQLLAVEDDLIDAYEEGELSKERRLSFENHFLRSPHRQARAGFAKAWMAYVSRQPQAVRAPAKPSTRPASFRFFSVYSWPVGLRVAALVLVIVAAGVLAATMLRLRGRVELAETQRAELERKQRDLEQQMEEERRRSSELSTQLERERAEREQQTPDQLRTGIVSFLLTPGMVRATGDSKRRLIPADARVVTLQLSFQDGDYDSYAVSITTVGGREVFRRAGLKASPRGGVKLVTLQVPASVFATEDYLVNLSGAGSSEKIAQYFFSALRK